MVNKKRNVWVIKDSKGNFSGGIREYEKGVFTYLSYHTFSMECRCQTSLLRATNLICDLRDKAMYVVFGEKFHLEYVGLDELSEHKEFTGEDNMIVLDINIFPSSNMTVTPAVLMNKSNVIRIPYPLTV